MLSGDEFYGDEVTSGPLDDDDPYAWPCDQCGAEPGEDCRAWCTSVPHAQDDSGAEFGVLFSHASEMVWPDRIGRAFPDDEAARAYGASIARAQDGTEFAVMCHCAGRPQWVEVGTGQSAHQVIARLWSDQIAARIAGRRAPLKRGSALPSSWTTDSEAPAPQRGRGFTDQHDEAGYHSQPGAEPSISRDPHPLDACIMGLRGTRQRPSAATWLTWRSTLTEPAAAPRRPGIYEGDGDEVGWDPTRAGQEGSERPE